MELAAPAGREWSPPFPRAANGARGIRVEGFPSQKGGDFATW